MLKRRTVLGRGVAGLGLLRCFGCDEDRAAPAPAAKPQAPATQPVVTRWLPLERTVDIPLDALGRPWSAVPFQGRIRLPENAHTPGKRVRLRGLAIRLPEEAGPSDDDRLCAFSTMCPHEICEVKFVENTAQIRVDRGPTPKHPLLFCPCHLSVYDPLADGAPLAGPAPRGAFRFAAAVVGDVLQITAVEDGVIHVT